jgi:hypothetical protein
MAPKRQPAAGHYRPDTTHRRTLELLAGCPNEGCAEAVKLAHGFTVAQLVELVRSGLATATPQRVTEGGQRMQVATLQITARGGRRWRWRSHEEAP